MMRAILVFLAGLVLSITGTELARASYIHSVPAPAVTSLTTQEAHAADTVSCAEPVSGMTLTVGVTGTYLVTFTGTLIADDGGMGSTTVDLSLQKNGSAISGGIILTSGDGTVPVATGAVQVPVSRALLVSLTAADVVRVSCATGGGTVQVSGRSLVLVKTG